MKKNITRAVLAGIIMFLLCCCIILMLEHHYLEDKYQTIQKSVDNMFWDYISNIDIRVGGAADDDEIFEIYTMVYEKLN